MAVADFFISLGENVMRILNMQMPFFNIPIWSCWVGIALITLSINVFRSIFDKGGIGIRYGSVHTKYHRKGDDE